jgi:polysaccharide export outer membrane protein
MSSAGSRLSLCSVFICACLLLGGWSVAAAQEPASELYLIGPRDTLNVFVAGQPDLSVTLPVRDDGRITTPRVEDMMAVGKSPSQLARDIEDVLRQRDLRAPEVTVMVTASSGGSFQSQVRVLGQVRTPGNLPFRNGMTVLDAITEVGGLTEFAAGRRGSVTRTIDGEQQEIKVNLKKLLDGDLNRNVELRQGDTIVVPTAAF